MLQISMIFIFSCSLIVLQGQASDTIPRTKEMLKKFYSLYENQQSPELYLTFEKRKEGLFAVSNRWEKGELVPFKHQLFYNRKTGRYQDVDLEKKKTPGDSTIPVYIDDFLLYNYDLQPYFGYPGWYKDVIAVYENKKQVTDDELYALGRAYGVYVTSLLSNQSGDAVKKEIWKLPMKINSLTPSQLQQIDHLAKAAQQSFKKLAARNPGYPTRVGTIGVKYANEVMFHFHQMLVYAYDHALKMKLPEGLYKQDILATARERLIKCPSNAILFSFGDNDFYPVYYLQHKEGLRKDVYLINYNLLGLKRDVFRITQPCFNAKPVRLSATPYWDRDVEVIGIRDTAKDMSVNELLEIIMSSPNYEPTDLRIDHILIPVQTTTSGTPTTSRNVRVSLKGVNYLLRNHWVLMDILQHLQGRKFCVPAQFEEIKGLNQYLLPYEDFWLFNDQ